MSSGAMKGEAQLINLMHTRYCEGLRDMVAMIGGDDKQLAANVDLANKLSTINVNNYWKVWGKLPTPQKILEIGTDGNILCTDRYLDTSNL